MAPEYRPVERTAFCTDIGERIDMTEVSEYLPANYRVIRRGLSLVIEGHDVAGWTLDGYVLPRLASGLHFFREHVFNDATSNWVPV